jgi:hypothetical protein
MIILSEKSMEILYQQVSPNLDLFVIIVSKVLFRQIFRRSRKTEYRGKRCFFVLFSVIIIGILWVGQSHLPSLTAEREAAYEQERDKAGNKAAINKAAVIQPDTVGSFSVCRGNGKS